MRVGYFLVGWGAIFVEGCFFEQREILGRCPLQGPERWYVIPPRYSPPIATLQLHAK